MLGKDLRYYQQTLERYDLPIRMAGGIYRYVEKKIPPGSFLYALFANDLMQTFAKADDTNRQKILDYVKFLYDQVPYCCYGSYEAVQKWCASAKAPDAEQVTWKRSDDS